MVKEAEKRRAEDVREQGAEPKERRDEKITKGRGNALEAMQDILQTSRMARLHLSTGSALHAWDRIGTIISTLRKFAL